MERDGVDRLRRAGRGRSEDEDSQGVHRAPVRDATTLVLDAETIADVAQRPRGAEASSGDSRRCLACVLAGVSMRAAAASAVTRRLRRRGRRRLRGPRPAAGIERVPTRCRRAGSIAVVARRARAADANADAVVYGSGFEDDPRRGVVRSRAARVLWGNPPDVLRQVRAPARAARDAGASSGLSGAAHRSSPASPRRLHRPARPGWRSRCSSGGGHGIRRWHAGRAVPGRLLPRGDSSTAPRLDRVRGRAGARVRRSACSRQLAGDAAFGAAGLSDTAAASLSHPADLFEQRRRGGGDGACARRRRWRATFELVGAERRSTSSRGTGVAVSARSEPALVGVDGTGRAARRRSRCSACTPRRARGGTAARRPRCRCAVRRAVGKAIVFARSRRLRPATPRVARSRRRRRRAARRAR